ncbi:MAG: ABC transporter permease [Clostridia bacterium]|nr:ABC transporter permease [Clostridia bacterium]
MSDLSKRSRRNRGLMSFASSIIAILIGLLFGFIILLVSHPDQAVDGFVTILRGGFFGGASSIGQMINIAVPIIMTGLSVGFAYRTGLFNIGTPGQFTTGAFAAIYIGSKWTFLPAPIHWVVAVLGAMLVGAVWGSIPGFLKAYRNVNEVISAIMLNYIGMYLVNMLVVETVYDQLRNQSRPVKAAAKIPTLGLAEAFKGSYLNMSILICIVFVIVVYIIVSKTTFGYELRAVGLNPFASRYAGINSKRSIVVSMIISGGLAGIGGGLMYLGQTGVFLQVVDVLAPQGFNGIPVALLGLNNPIGIFFSGLFVASLTVGGYNLQLFEFTPEVIDMIIAVIIYCSAFTLLFKNLMEQLLAKRKAAAVKEEEER